MTYSAVRSIVQFGGVGVGLPYPLVLPRPTSSCSPPPAGAPAFPARGLAVAVLVQAMPSPGGLGWEHLGLGRRPLTLLHVLEIRNSVTNGGHGIAVVLGRVISQVGEV